MSATFLSEVFGWDVAATPISSNSLIPNYFSVLFCYVFAPRGTLEIAEVARLAARDGFDSITLL